MTVYLAIDSGDICVQKVCAHLLQHGWMLSREAEMVLNLTSPPERKALRT